MRTGIAKAAVGQTPPRTAQDAFKKIRPGTVQTAVEQIRTDLGHETVGTKHPFTLRIFSEKTNCEKKIQHCYLFL
jgi:hypothetical protein